MYKYLQPPRQTTSQKGSHPTDIHGGESKPGGSGSTQCHRFFRFDDGAHHVVYGPNTHPEHLVRVEHGGRGGYNIRVRGTRRG